MASYFRMSYLRIFLICLLFLNAFSMLWARKSLSSVSLSIEGEKEKGRLGLFPDRETKLSVKIKNQGFLPIVWMRLFLPVGERKVVAFPDGGEEESFAWIMPGQALSYEIEIRALRRGIFAPDYIEVSSGDGFGLKESKKQFMPEKLPSILVFPGLIPVNEKPLIGKMTELEEAKQGIYKDRTLIRSVRDYELHDSAKDINWRQLAKEGKLSVNVREEEDSRRLCFLLDLESYSHEEESFDADGTLRKKRVLDEEGLEEVLSLAASLIRKLSQKQIRCSLILPAYGEKESQILFAGKKEKTEYRMLSALSAISYQGEKTELPLREMTEKRHELGPVFFLAAKESRRLELLKKEKKLRLCPILKEKEGKKKEKNEIAWREVCHESEK